VEDEEKEQERIERMRIKQWTRKAKMRRVFAEVGGAKSSRRSLPSLQSLQSMFGCVILLVSFFFVPLQVEALQHTDPATYQSLTNIGGGGESQHGPAEKRQKKLISEDDESQSILGLVKVKWWWH